MEKALAPIDLLKEFRAGFEAEAKYNREKQSEADTVLENVQHGVRAASAELMIRKIDRTLRDWA